MPPPPGDDAHPDFGQPHTRGFGGDTEIAGQGEFESAPIGQAVQGGGQYEWAGFEPVEQILDSLRKVQRAGRVVLNHFHRIGAAAEIFTARAKKDHGPGRSGFNFGQNPVNFVHERRIDGVSVSGPVYGHPGNISPMLHQGQGLISRHDFPLYLFHNG